MNEHLKKNQTAASKITVPGPLYIFDWDGTLYESTHWIAHSLVRASAAVGLPPPSLSQAQYVIGLGMTEAVHYLYPTLSSELTQRYIEQYRLEYANGDRDSAFYPGILNLLNTLKQQGALLAVATGKSRAGLNRALAASGTLDLFDCTRTADETRSKPDPLMVQQILDTLGIAAQHSIVIGDTTFDIEMAHAAGCASVGICHGAHAAQDLVAAKATYLARDVAQLVTILSHWQSRLSDFSVATGSI